MARRLREAGFSVTEEASSADAIIVNTCSFIQAATEESIDAIFEAASLPKVDEHDLPCAGGDLALDVLGDLLVREAVVAPANGGDGGWGADLPDGRDLAWLVDTLAEAHPDTWFRVMYLQPEGATDELLSVMAARGRGRRRRNGTAPRRRNRGAPRTARRSRREIPR